MGLVDGAWIEPHRRCTGEHWTSGVHLRRPAGSASGAQSYILIAGTGLSAGDRLPGLLGYEVDRLPDEVPDGLEVLAASPWQAMNDPAQQRLSHRVLHAAASGALVFGAGTIQWAWGLDDFNAPRLRSSRASPAAQQITRNLLARFGSSAGRP